MRIRGLLWKKRVKGFGVRLFRLLPYRRRFGYAWLQHGRCYDMRGDWWTRRFFDIRFLESMLKSCHTDSECSCAMLYYTAVRLFGWLFYRYDR